LQQELRVEDVFIQKLDDVHLKDAEVDILRLDKIHKVVSGNKWFKLKYYLREAIERNYNSIATFGGPFSNHILATAYACHQQNIPCLGYIRGGRPKILSQTLIDAEALNMHLEFLSRDEYTNKQKVIGANPFVFFIPEGGYGKAGADGASEILELVPDLFKYNYIVCATGTGTMLAGIANASMPHQQCIGISVMKNNMGLEAETLYLVNDDAVSRVKLLHDHHFGGYAKYTQELIDFINTTWTIHHLPLDFVYTAKALYAIYDLSENKYFVPGSKILFIHSGGLQGNRSLGKKILFNQ